MGEGLGMGTVVMMGIDGIEEGPETGWNDGIDGIKEGPGTGWIDGIEEGPLPGTGWIDGSREGPEMGWEFDVDSVEVDSKHELLLSQYHTFVEIEIQ